MPVGTKVRVVEVKAVTAQAFVLNSGTAVPPLTKRGIGNVALAAPPLTASNAGDAGARDAAKFAVPPTAPLCTHMPKSNCCPDLKTSHTAVAVPLTTGS